MAFLPIMLNTKGLPCLVIGGGKVALHKVLILLRFGAVVTVVAAKGVKGLEKLAARNLVIWRRRRFKLMDLAGQKLVIAATNDRAVNSRVAWWAKRLGIAFNCVDDPELSGFIFPAIYLSGPLTVSVSTQGAYPAAARQIKRDLMLKYGVEYGKYLGKLQGYRRNLKKAEPDARRRRLLLRKLLHIEVETMNLWSEADFEVWLQHEQKS